MDLQGTQRRDHCRACWQGLLAPAGSEKLQQVCLAVDALTHLWNSAALGALWK